MFGLDPAALATFRHAMMQPVGDWTGGDVFKLMHTYTLDLLLPAMTAFPSACFFSDLPGNCRALRRSNATLS